MPPHRLILRRLATIAWTGFAVLAILAGVLVGLGRLLLPFAEHAEPRLEAWLSSEFQRRVEIGAVGATWELAGPEFRLTHVRFFEPHSNQAGLELAQAQVDVNLLAWLFRTGPALEFHIADTELHIRRDREGRFSINGLGADNQADDTSRGLEWLLRQGRISLVDARIRYTDAVRNLRLNFADVDITLDNSDGVSRIAGQARFAPAAAGRLEWRAVLEQDGSERFTGRFYVHSSGLGPGSWLETLLPERASLRGEIDFSLWGTVAGSALERILVHVRAQDLALRTAQIKQHLDHIEGWLKWVRLPQGWRLSGEKLHIARAGDSWPETGFTFEYTDQAVRFGANYVPAADLAPLASLIFDLPSDWEDRLLSHDPVGALQDLAVEWRRDAQFPQGLSMRAVLDNVGWQAYRAWPGMTGIDGQLAFDADSGRFQLGATQVSFSYPRLFRAPLEFDRIQGRIELAKTSDGWLLHTPRLAVRASGAQAASRIRLVFNGQGERPFMALHGKIRGGQAAAAKAFWPVGVMPEELVAWLDRALLDGRFERGEILVYGDLEDWPFDNGTGRFEARVRIADATLDYHPEWPVVTGVNARLLFQGRTMLIESHTGVSKGVALDHVAARIANLQSPLLALDIESHGKAGNLLQFLRASPLNDDYGYYLDGLSATGQGRVQTQLLLPLKKELGEEQITGQIGLDDVDLEDAKWDVRFNQINGRIAFDEGGFSASDLDLKFRERAAQLDLAVGDHTPEGAIAVATLTGRFAPAMLIGAYAAPWTALLQGRSLWRLHLTVPDAGAGPLNRAAARLTLTSDLAGTAIHLPAPLAKLAPESLPFALRLPLPYDGGLLAFHYGDRLAGMLWPQAPGGIRGQIRFGAAQSELPKKSGVIVTGAMEYLNLDHWFGLLGAGATSGQGRDWLRRIDLDINKLVAIGRPFNNTHVLAATDADGWHITLTGDQVEGEIRVPASDNAGLVGDFDRLVLAPIERETGGMSLVDPRRLPALHLVINNFTLSGAELGRTRLEAWPLPDGLRVGLLRTESDNFGLEADGTWTVTETGDQRSAFDLTITAASLGQMLANFGYAGLVENGTTVAHLDVAWPGQPSRFALSRLAGNMEVEVGAGRLIPVDPGAGRIFGLLSVQALPRRLALDFSDFFGAGLSFDAIVGSFRFDDGVARTDDLILKGPAARIEVVGQIDMVAQTYDQLVTIYPSVGTTLPLVGALAAGAPGAAALFVIQGLFQDQIRSIASYAYRVTGPWADPVFEPVETVPPHETSVWPQVGD